MNVIEIHESGLIRCSDGKFRPEWACSSPLLQEYYDHEWGRPVATESEMFERIVLEGFQAGLSWETILKKRPAFREAFCNFDVDTVADFGEEEVGKLLENPGIIRNERKIRAAISNAQRTQELREEGGLLTFLQQFVPEKWERPQTVIEAKTLSAESTAMAKALKKKGFTFVGPTTCFALMEATGLVNNRVLAPIPEPGLRD